MNTPYHQKPIDVAFVSPSTNLFGKSQNCLRNRLGLRARLIPFKNARDAMHIVSESIVPYELIALDSAAIPAEGPAPQFVGASGEAIPVLLLLRKGETTMAERAMEGGYKAFLFIDCDTQFRQLFPGMILRMVAYYRGERQRQLLDYHDDELPETNPFAEELSQTRPVLEARQ